MNRKRRDLAVLLGVGLLALAAPAQEDGKVVALKGGRVVCAPGKVLEGATLLLQHGRIEALGGDVEIPWEAEAVDCRGLWLYPGFVHPASRQGLPGAGNPNFKAAAEVDPFAAGWKDLLEAGFTTVGLVPRGRGVAGQVAVVAPRGRTRPELVRIETAAVSLGAGGDGATAEAVMKAVEAAQKELETRRQEAEKKAQSQPAASQPASAPAPRKVEPFVELLVEVLEGRLPAFVEVQGPTGLLYLERALGKTRFPMLLLADGQAMGAPPISDLADRIKKMEAAVLLPMALAQPPYQESLVHPPAALQAAGVEVLLQPGASRGELRSFRLRLAELVRTGWSEEEALAAVTTRPARWLGVADRVGALAEGHDANVLIFSGPMLDPATRLLRVFLEGDSAYEYGKD